MGNSNLETRSLLDELSSFEKGGFFDLGHPLLNRIAESFVKAAGVTFLSLTHTHACLCTCMCVVLMYVCVPCGNFETLL